MMDETWLKGVSLDLNVHVPGENGWEERHLSQVSDIFHDKNAVCQTLENEDPLIYAYHSLNVPATAGDIAFGISQVESGKIGNEYYMTKGHFHQIVDTGEVYYTLSGQGYLLIENAEGDSAMLPMKPGCAVYAPKGYAHRTINTGSEPLVSFFAFRADAGHDYKTILTNGFLQRVEGKGGQVVSLPNEKK